DGAGVAASDGGDDSIAAAVFGGQDHAPWWADGDSLWISIHFGYQYQERDRFDRLMVRLRLIEKKMDGFMPVVNTPLRA
ncbi:MAG: hypothetical protein NTX13_00320, partial [Acidobacteria bacterium]|nr:hypothetical protein [Acidobacteriota bacterium]